MSSVKISQLPVRSVVFNNDRIPVVDAAETQTATVTAAQIAAIGGGPPADNSVTTAKLANKSVTYPKIQDVLGNMLLGRFQNTPGDVEETPLSPFMRAVLAAPDSATAVALLGALASTVDPTFTGQVKLADGTAGAPSLAFTSDPDTGLFRPAPNTIGISTDGYERFRIGEDGTLYNVYPGTSLSTTLRSAFFARAWMNFDGTGAQNTTINNQHTICQRYRGVWGSLANTPNTRAKIIAMEAANGNTLLDGNIGSLGTESRNNYTTCGDNTHWYWTTNDPNAGAWATMPACNSNWIGNITFSSAGSVGIRQSGGFASVTRASAGQYTLTFLNAMPDSQYAVIVNSGSGTAFGIANALTTTNFAVQIRQRSDGTQVDSANIHVIVVR